jgi:hypothetical protein
MIIVKLIGGLGNQMFQYAVGRHLAIKNNTTLKLDIEGFKEYKLRNYDLKYFNIQENIAQPTELSTIIFPSDGMVQKIKKNIKINLVGIQSIRYVQQCRYEFQPETLDLGNNIYLDGTWQSEKFFEDISSTIKNEFSLKTPLIQEYAHYADLIRESESVCIHLRRGDYISNPVANKILGICPLDYYYSAIKTIEKKLKCPHYFIFSDDPSYIKEIFTHNSSMSIVSPDNVNNTFDYQELYLMSLCKHQIIANSTFSWWSAWLNKNSNKIIIAPNIWFKDNSINTIDLIPNNWITI